MGRIVPRRPIHLCSAPDETQDLAIPDAIRAVHDEIAALGDGEEADGRLDPIAHLIEGARASGSEER
jgi:hypothetical protein